MSQVYNNKEQVLDLIIIRIVPEFKVENAVIHFDETSPHIHIVGVPIKEDYKRGMRKQPAKSKVFTKESLLQQIQDQMRNCCIKSYNKVYCDNSLLKQKKKGRNQDIGIKERKRKKKKKYIYNQTKQARTTIVIFLPVLHSYFNLLLLLIKPQLRVLQLPLHLQEFQLLR